MNYDNKNIDINCDIELYQDSGVTDVSSPTSYEINSGNRILKRIKTNYSPGKESSVDYDYYQISNGKLDRIVNLLEKMKNNRKNDIHKYTFEECISNITIKEKPISFFGSQITSLENEFFRIKYDGEDYYTSFSDEMRIINNTLEMFSF